MNPYLTDIDTQEIDSSLGIRENLNILREKYPLGWRTRYGDDYVMVVEHEQKPPKRLTEIIELLKDKPYYIDALNKILEHQERELRCSKCGSRDFTRVSKYTYKCNRCGAEVIYTGFTPIEVGVEPHIIRKMVYDGLVKVLDKTSRKTTYILEDEELIRMALATYEEQPKMSKEPEDEKASYQEIPEDIFNNIVGYDDVKTLLIRALRSPEPVAVLLVGPPASAKSMFLQEISRIEGSYMVVAGTTTKAGIRDVILEVNPRILLIDELDKINDSKDLSVLLSVIDPGHIIVTMRRRRIKRKVRIWIIASANRTDNIPQELLSRFIVLRFKEYEKDELREIIIKTITKRYGKDEELAEYIADKTIFELDIKDPRIAINIAKIVNNKKEVDFMVNMLQNYR